MSKDDSSFWQEEGIAGEVGGEYCNEGTKVFNYESDPGVVSVDHSGEWCECPENASRLGSTVHEGVRWSTAGGLERTVALVATG